MIVVYPIVSDFFSLAYFYFWRQMSHYVDEGGLILIEIHLPLSPWMKGLHCHILFTIFIVYVFTYLNFPIFCVQGCSGQAGGSY